MHFGLVPREWGDFFQDAYEQIKVAEQVGFESVWFEEHHGSLIYIPCPIDALNALAMHTTLKLGTAIVILPLYHPVRLAEQFAQLDVITHGRVIIGVGAGYREKDFINYGIRLEDRGILMEEGLILLNKLLSEEDVTFEGKVYRIKNATIQPRPFQKPRPPIWVGGWKRTAIKRAAKYGDAWFPGPVATFTEVIKCKKIYEEEMEKLSKKVPPLPIMRDCYVAVSDEIAFKEAEESFRLMYDIDYSSSGHPLIGGKRMKFSEWAYDRFLIGSPSSIIEEIAKFRKNGFNYVILRLSLRKLSNEQVKESIRLLGEKVITYFKQT
jgi:alkanesulfonate monooxygenase SsuD/methylene tetrahydromethanopterin reductase-like flavin-dependent oxidoreductase (luciferase family)